MFEEVSSVERKLDMVFRASQWVPGATFSGGYIVTSPTLRQAYHQRHSHAVSFLLLKP